MAKNEIQFVPAKSVEGEKEAKQAISLLQSGLEKKFGKNTLVRMGDRVGVKIDSIPTGIYSVDQKGLQVGGVPKGRIIEIYGPESSGKTTAALQIVAQAQKVAKAKKTGKKAGFVDAEHALDPNWAAKLGVDVDDLLISQPDHGEQALEIAIDMVESGAFSVIVIDSVAALVPRAELDGEMGDSHVGLQARMMSQALRKLTGAVSKTGTIVIFINQIREKIGVMFGSPETTTGGRALKFFASVRIDVRRIAAVKDGEAVIGNRVRWKFVKNKVAAPFRECEVDLLFEFGYDTVGDTLDSAVLSGVVEKSGAWYNYAGERLGQGRTNTIKFLRSEGKLIEKIYAETVEVDTKALEAAKAKGQAAI